jgi:hypothetical protein
MKKIVLSTLLAMSLATAGNCGMFDAIKNLASKTAENPLTDQDIDAIFLAEKNAKILASSSLVDITGVLVNAKAKATLVSALKDAEKIKDEAQRDEKKEKLLSDAATAAVAAGQAKEAQDTLAKLNPKQKKEAQKAFDSYALAGQVDLKAIKMGQDVGSRAMQDPLGAGMKFATKLGKVKDLVVALPAKATEIGKLSQEFYSIAKAGHIEINTPTDEAISAAASVGAPVAPAAKKA